MRSSILADPPPDFSTETALATELLKLNFKDRAELEEEIHGVHCGAAIETPELLESSLAEFDSKINVLKENDAGKGALRNVIRISSLDKAEAEKAAARAKADKKSSTMK